MKNESRTGGHSSGLNITVFSADGNLNIGIVGCTDQTPDPWAIANAFDDEIKNYKLEFDFGEDAKAEEGGEAAGGGDEETRRMDEGEKFEKIEAGDFGKAEAGGDLWRVQQQMRGVRETADGLGARNCACIPLGIGAPEARMGCDECRILQRGTHVHRTRQPFAP